MRNTASWFGVFAHRIQGCGTFLRAPHASSASTSSVLYFLGIAPQRYTVIWPAYIVEWSASALKARLAFGDPASTATAWTLPTTPERRYSLRIVRQC